MGTNDGRNTVRVYAGAMDHAGRSMHDRGVSVPCRKLSSFILVLILLIFITCTACSMPSPDSMAEMVT